MVAPKTGLGGTDLRLEGQKMNDDVGSAGTDDYGSLAQWLTFSTVATNANKWVGLSNTKSAFYKFSLVYDGYQEGALINTDVVYHTANNTTDITTGLSFTIKIDADWGIPQRATSMAVYRADDDEFDAADPGGLYKFVEEIPLVSFNYDSGNNLWTYVVIDDGDTNASYSAINGLDETITNLELSYTACTSLNGYMFVGNCTHKEFEDAENFIFRSQPGKFSIFDWSKDFTQVPFVPVAMAGFMGKLYVWGESQMAIINPESLTVEDTVEGVGCIGPKAIQNTPTGLFWYDQSNIYQSVPKLNKIGTTILKQADFGWEKLSNAEKSSAVSGYDATRQCYLIFFTHITSNRCWAYYIPHNRWDLWETEGKVYDTITSDDGYPILLLGEGKIRKYLAGPNRRDWTFETKKMTMGADTLFKKVRVIKVDASNRSAMTLQYKTDDFEGSWNNGTDISNSYGSTWKGLAKKIASAHSKLRWIKLKATGNNDTAGSNHKVYAMGTIYKPKSAK